jgi:hypothetical protein
MNAASNLPGVKFARWVFLVAAVWGVLVLTPMYFLYDGAGAQTPTALTNPDFYYGFASVALAWQVLFFFVSTNPARYRPIIIPSLLEKFGYVATLGFLFMQKRVAPTLLPFAAADLVLGVLFAVAFLKLHGSRVKPDQP